MTSCANFFSKIQSLQVIISYLIGRIRGQIWNFEHCVCSVRNLHFLPLRTTNVVVTSFSNHFFLHFVQFCCLSIFSLPFSRSFSMISLTTFQFVCLFEYNTDSTSRPYWQFADLSYSWWRGQTVLGLLLLWRIDMKSKHQMAPCDDTLNRIILLCSVGRIQSVNIYGRSTFPTNMTFVCIFAA